MNKENLQQKLDEYKKQHEQTKANLNALAGAIQVLEQLIKEEHDGNGKGSDKAGRGGKLDE